MPKVQAQQIQYVGVSVPDYGIQVDSPHPLEIERALFLRGGSEFYSDGIPNLKGKSKAHHFWRIVDMFWNYQGSRVHIHRHPWAERIIEALCTHGRVSIAGCASSGKSRTVAAWAIVNFLCYPRKTRVMLTSTTLKDSRGRIWGDVEELWQALPGELPGTLVSSQGFIRFKDPITGEQNEKMGLFLVAGEKSKESESLGKLIGFKAERMFLIADEMPELSETLIDAAESNLSSNPNFQMVGIGNPNSYYDPHGIFSEPLNGWHTISEQDYEWQGKKSFVIRFNAEESPNFGPAGVKWEYLMTRERLRKFQEDLGEKTLKYYRMVKGFWFSESGADCIYSALLLQNNKAHDKAVFKGEPTMIAGLDPAFTHGGDDCVLTIGRVGDGTEGHIIVERVATIFLHEDINDKTVTRTEQMALKAVSECAKWKVEPSHVAVDSTGGGAPWCDMLAVKWQQNTFRRVGFGSRADDPEKYVDRMSEIWFEGQPLIRSGQVRGIDAPLAREMVAREYTMSGKRIKVQPKDAMKKIIGKSPDNADSFFLMLDMARKRGKLKSHEGDDIKKPSRKKFRALAALWDR